ncbi:MlaE family ABC transporter permease [Desulfoplanes formicivorans]|uniref:ABC transporter permease n=1 Tax=Desulfoplanes formicivorans TaxID=1592317 RepID=A0A194AHK9_9BACT|nr:ABC transporter permease [Desulfoplanes formicivorans]
MSPFTIHMLTPFASAGRLLIGIMNACGAYAIFSAQGLVKIFSLPFQASKILQQIYFIGARSVSIIALVALFTGMVLGLQLYYTLTQFGSEGALGSAVALSLVRELGPVLTAIMITARAGSSMTAEIGVMRISEQIDALDTMAIDPIRFLISPKLAASLISFPLLTALYDVVGIIGGYIAGVVLLGLNKGIYFYRVESSVVMQDVTGGFIKSIAFAFLVSTICSFQGYFTHTRQGGFGAKGVGMATTSAVVISCVWVLIVDYVLTSFLL